jgi:hypothetical protein
VSLHHRLLSACAAVAVILAISATVASAQQQTQDQSVLVQGGNGRGKPNPTATPELDTALLYGAGLIGIAAPWLYIRRRKGQGGSNPEA